MIAKGLLSTDHPVLAHVIPMRRCNSGLRLLQRIRRPFQAGPLETMRQRLDRLAALGTTIVTISGGEPLLHPDLDEIVAHVRRRGMIAGLITNGYLLTADRVKRLNRAGLDHLQISIDNVLPDEVSKKSLKVLDRKLQVLAEHAEFHVNINSVVGGGIRNPQDALVVAGARWNSASAPRWASSTMAAANCSRSATGARSLSGHALHGEEQLRADQLLPGQHRAGQGERLAVPRRLALPLYLRRRPGALLLPAARLPRQAPDGIHARTISAANTAPPKLRPAARSRASTRSPTSTSGAASSAWPPQPWPTRRRGWCRFSSAVTAGSNSRLECRSGQFYDKPT